MARPDPKHWLKLALNQYRLAVLVGFAGLLGTAWATLQVQAESRKVQLVELARAGEHQVAALRTELDDVVHPVEALAAFVRAEPALDQARFNAFAQQILAVNPIVHVLAWAPRVGALDRPAFEAGDPTGRGIPFGILEVDANGNRLAASARDTYYPVLLAAPQPLNERLLGLDLASEPSWKEAMLRSNMSGRFAAIGRVSLLDELDSGGIVVIMPVHRGEIQLGMPAGFAVAALDLNSIADSHPALGDAQTMTLELVDRTGPYGRQLLGGAHGGGRRRIVHAETIEFGGRQLEVRCWSAATIRGDPVKALSTLLLGATVTALLVAYTTVVLGRKVLVEREVALRTSELAEARDRAERDARAVADLNRALIQRNRELDEILFVTSHDLQEPARKIAFFTDMLSKNLARENAFAFPREIDGITRATERLRDLLRDLQALASIGRSEVTLLPVDVELCAGSAINEHAALIQKLGATVTSDPMPTVLANATLLTRVYSQLLHNALKFGRPGEPPLVHLTVQRAGEDWILGVRDNGVGVDPRNAETVFAPFRRLHTGPDNTGTGIGLALCKKVIERLSGRIWVEPTEGGGAHFRFTVPMAGLRHVADPGR